MPKPPSSTRTVRLADEAWEWLKAEGEKRGETVNAMVGIAVGNLRRRPVVKTSLIREGPSLEVGDVVLINDEPPARVTASCPKPKPFRPHPKPTRGKK